MELANFFSGNSAGQIGGLRFDLGHGRALDRHFDVGGADLHVHVVAGFLSDAQDDALRFILLEALRGYQHVVGTRRKRWY